jgi:hypothetical protein
MLCWMASEYVKEHKADLEAMVAADQAARAKAREEEKKRVEENDARHRKKMEELEKKAAAKGMTVDEFIDHEHDLILEHMRRPQA